MAIEIRQLTIHSQVSARAEEPRQALAKRELEEFKEQFLPECRQMVMEMIRAERER